VVFLALDEAAVAIAAFADPIKDSTAQVFPAVTG
jgi:hypothetical protein